MTYPPQDPHQPPPPQWPPVPPGQYPQGGYGPAPVPPVPAKKGMSTGAVLAIIGAGFIGLCCVGGIVTSIVSPSSSTSTSTTSSDTATASAPTTEAAPKPPSAGLALAAWWNGGAKDRAQAIGDDFDTIGKAAGSGNQRDIRAGCAKAQKDVEAAQAYGQVPDGQAQTLYAAALASYARASADCIAGIDSFSPSLVSKSGDEINAGNDSMVKLAARIRELGSK